MLADRSDAARSSQPVCAAAAMCESPDSAASPRTPARWGGGPTRICATPPSFFAAPPEKAPFRQGLVLCSSDLRRAAETAAVIRAAVAQAGGGVGYIGQQGGAGGGGGAGKPAHKNESGGG